MSSHGTSPLYTLVYGQHIGTRSTCTLLPDNQNFYRLTKTLTKRVVVSVGWPERQQSTIGVHSTINASQAPGNRWTSIVAYTNSGLRSVYEVSFRSDYVTIPPIRYKLRARYQLYSLTKPQTCGYNLHSVYIDSLHNLHDNSLLIKTEVHYYNTQLSSRLHSMITMFMFYYYT